MKQCWKTLFANKHESLFLRRERYFAAQVMKIGNKTLETENCYISLNRTTGRVVNNVEKLISSVYSNIFNLSKKYYQWPCENCLRRNQ